MNKPLVLIIDELHDSIITLMNSSNLPPSQLEPIIREIYNQVAEGRKREAEQARQQYEAELAKEAKGEQA